MIGPVAHDDKMFASLFAQLFLDLFPLHQRMIGIGNQPTVMQSVLPILPTARGDTAKVQHDSRGRQDAHGPEQRLSRGLAVFAPAAEMPRTLGAENALLFSMLGNGFLVFSATRPRHTAKSLPQPHINLHLLPIIKAPPGSSGKTSQSGPRIARHWGIAAGV